MPFGEDWKRNGCYCYFIHFVLGCVSDWYFLWLKEGGPGYYLCTELMGMHMNYT